MNIPTINENGHMEIEGRFFIPTYRILWSDSETCSDPDNEGDYDTLEEAIEAAKTPGEYWNANNEHYNRVVLHLQEVVYEIWGDEETDGDWNETGRNMAAGSFDFETSIDDELFFQSHKARETDSTELRYETIDSLGNDLVKHFDNLTYSGSSKYSTLFINDEDGEEEGTINLRIADHSYNPANNVGCDNFISVEIANVNPTKGRYNGKYGIQFDGSNTYDEVLEAVIERVEDILSNY